MVHLLTSRSSRVARHVLLEVSGVVELSCGEKLRPCF